MKSKIGAILGLPLNSDLPRVRIASLCVLPFELQNFLFTLQYANEGEFQAFPDEVKAGTRPTWGEFCMKNGSITPATQVFYLRVFVVILGRFHALGNIGATSLMLERPSMLTDREIEVLIDTIANDGLTENDSLGSLKREYKERFSAATPENRLVTKPSQSPLDVVFQAAQIQEMALAAGVETGMAGKIAMKILSRDFSATGNPRGLIRYWKKRPVAAGSQTLNTPEK